MSGFNIQEWHAVIAIVAMAFATVSVVVQLWLNARYVTKTDQDKGEEKRREEYDALRALVSLHEGRLAALELMLKHLPSSEKFYELSLAIERVTGRMDGLGIKLDSTNERLDHLGETVQRHESIFSEGARGGA